MSGAVVHFEIPADNMNRAQTFYREVFGWQLNAVPDMDYAMITTTPSGPDGMPIQPGAINGGMMARQTPVTTPVVTVDVEDIDAALAKIESLGGRTAIGCVAVGDMGFTAYFHDPEGNLVGLWQSARPA